MVDPYRSFGRRPRSILGTASAVAVAAIAVLSLLPGSAPHMGFRSGQTGDSGGNGVGGTRAGGTPAPVDFGPSLANHSVSWSQVAPPPSGFGANGGMATDPATADAIEFGGIAGNRLVNTTLVYNETTNGWTNRSGTIAPGPRADVAFAFDPAANFGALFGGLTNLTSLASSNDTWKVSASGAWTREVAGSGPAARQASAFAIDPSLGIGLLYGGWNQSFSPTSAVLYSDLWALNLTHWR